MFLSFVHVTPHLNVFSQWASCQALVRSWAKRESQWEQQWPQRRFTSISHCYWEGGASQVVLQSDYKEQSRDTSLQPSKLT